MDKAKNTCDVEESVAVARHGKVHRHTIRGIDEVGSNELKKQEDETCAAGLRNPADFVDKYGKTQEVMQRVARIIASCRANDPELVGLDTACGKSPGRSPPSEEALKRVRSAIGAELGLSAEECEQHHPASQWRFKIIQALLLE